MDPGKSLIGLFLNSLADCQFIFKIGISDDKALSSTYLN